MKDLRTGQLLDGEDRAHRLGRLGDRQQDAVLHDRGRRSRSARDKFWRHVVGHRRQRSDLRREGRAVRRRRRPIARQEDHLRRVRTRRPRREIRYLPADDPAAALEVILPRQDGHEYDVDHYNGEFYITTNKGAKNFRVVTAPMADPSEKNWKPFIAHKPGCKIDGLSLLRQPPRRLGARGRAELPAGHRHEDAAVAPHRHRRGRTTRWASLRNPEFDTTTIRFNYQSMVTPSSVYDYDLNTRQRTLLKRQEVLGGYDPANYEARRDLGGGARRHEGAGVDRLPQRARSSTARRRCCSTPTARTARRMTPTFSSSRLSLLDRGVDLRAGLHPRRRRARRGMARAGPHDEEDEHVQRLHRLRRLPGQEQVHVSGPARDSGRQRRRTADGRGRRTCGRICSRRSSRRCRSST